MTELKKQDRRVLEFVHEQGGKANRSAVQRKIYITATERPRLENRLKRAGFLRISEGVKGPHAGRPATIYNLTKKGRALFETAKSQEERAAA